MAVPVEDVPFTEFIQHPTASTSRLVHARALRLRRRDADDLLVMRAARADQEVEVVDLAVRMLAALAQLEERRELVQQLLPELLPWARFLPAGDRETLVREFIEVAEAATSIENVAPIAQLLIEWRHTAEVHADPELYAMLSRPRGEDHGPALPPDTRGAG